MSSRDRTDSNGIDPELISDFVGIAVKALTAVAGITAILYATGFLVVNINLLSLGAYEIGLQRERFVTAGIIFLLTFGFIFFVTIVMSYWIEEGQYVQHYNRALVKFIGTMAFMLPVLYVLIPSTLAVSATDGLYDAYTLYNVETLSIEIILFYFSRLAFYVLALILVSTLVDWMFPHLPAFLSSLWHSSKSLEDEADPHNSNEDAPEDNDDATSMAEGGDTSSDSNRSFSKFNSSTLYIIKFVLKFILGLIVTIPFLLTNPFRWFVENENLIHVSDLLDVNYQYFYLMLAAIVLLTLSVLEMIDAAISNDRFARRFLRRANVIRFGTFIGTMIILLLAALFLSLISSGLRLENIQGYIDGVDNAYQALNAQGDLQSRLGEGFEEFYNPLATRIIAWCLIFGSLIYFLRYARHSTEYAEDAADQQGDEPLPESNDNNIEDNGEAAAVPGWSVQFIKNLLDRKWPVPYFLLIFFLSLYFFSRDIYAAYPPALGGGLPIVVQFLAKGDHHGQLKQLGLFTSDDKLALSPKVDLVAQTSTHYIVLVFDPDLNQRTAVSFPKEYVDGVKFSPEEYYLNDQYVAERRTDDGRSLLAEGDYEGAIIEFRKALQRVEGYVPALLGLGDSQVEQAASDFESCNSPNAECYAEAICQFVEVVNSGKSELLDARSAANSEILQTQDATPAQVAQAHYGLARASAIVIRQLRDEEYIQQQRSREQFEQELIRQSESVCGNKINTQRERNNYNNVNQREIVDAAVNLLAALNLVENPNEFREQIIKDEAFDEDRFWTEDFYDDLFTTSENAAIRYIEEGDLAKEAEDYETAIDWYSRALSLMLKSDDFGQAEDEALLRHLIADVYLYLWNEDRTTDLFGWYYEWDCDEKEDSDSECFPVDLRNGTILEQVGQECDDPAVQDPQACVVEQLIIDEYKIAATKAPGDVNYQLDLPDTYVQFGKFEEAIELYESFLQINAGNSRALVGLGNTHLAAGNFNEARTRFQQVIDRQPEDANALFGHALAAASYLEQVGAAHESRLICGELRKAVEVEPAYLKRVEEIETFDKYEHCYSAAQSFEIGKTLESEGNMEEAIDAYVQATELYPTNAVYWMALANAFRQQELPSEAEDAYNEAIKSDANNDNYFYVFGTFYISIGRFDDAIDKLRDAISLDDSKAIYQTNLGNAYRLKANQSESDVLEGSQAYLQGAVNAYNEAIKIDDDNGDAYCGLVISYVKLNQVDVASEYMDGCENKSVNLGLIGEARTLVNDDRNRDDAIDASE